MGVYEEKIGNKVVYVLRVARLNFIRTPVQPAHSAFCFQMHCDDFDLLLWFN